MAQESLTETQETESNGRRMDSELKALNQILRIMDDVPPTSRDRMIRYVWDRYDGPQRLEIDDPL